MCPEVLGGIDQATNWERIRDIFDENRGMVQIFLLLVDRDGVGSRRQALDRLEQLANANLGSGKTLLAENAWQEIEVWALAGQNLPKEWQWKEIRAEIHPKEKYFEPLAEKRGLTRHPGEGRTIMGRQAATNYARVRSRCKEDIEALETKLKNWCGANGHA
jgi:hypothetical protein